ncbi:DNA-processing protein DprA [Jutongia huaianensis]|uniref:DNA-protecting protein DprA n=1 Tax=Jutongia huaianensis TaxID=2763668 RepID=A0ABR7N394_9FIRM|nr:DNA-processing protein DprA [Jutongia huaianensis]MBC8563083.1 DNA-protecting protein DprA [Jutongia huaianensis]CDE69133.1 dNA protecting protein DprA [Clostridium sp. CAG:277]
MKKVQYEFWLSSIPGIGCRKIKALLERFGAPEDIFRLKREQLQEISSLRTKDIETLMASRNTDQIQKDWEELCKKEIHFTSLSHPDYPDKLKHIPDPPYSLFYKGSLPAGDIPSVAVVGARNVSHAGLETARQFGRELAENGIAVVSGLARGVDVTAQNGVLTVAGGRTYGVLGCGIDRCYPENHIESYMLMQENGGVISEFCPGMLPYPANFPMRNRIISGLSDGILVIEAGKKSGSLITAELGLDQGKEVFVVPGDIYNPCYIGSNQLIQSGAALVTKTRDILDGLGIFMDEDASVRKKKCEVMLETSEKIVYSYLGLEPIHISELVRISGLSVQRTVNLLLSMELKGVVRQVGNQYYAIVL